MAIFMSTRIQDSRHTNNSDCFRSRLSWWPAHAQYEMPGHASIFLEQFFPNNNYACVNVFYVAIDRCTAQIHWIIVDVSTNNNVLIKFTMSRITPLRGSRNIQNVRHQGQMSISKMSVHPAMTKKCWSGTRRTKKCFKLCDQIKNRIVTFTFGWESYKQMSGLY